MDGVWEKLINAGIAILAGGIAGVLSPFITFRVERAKLLMAERRSFLKECREFIAKTPDRDIFRSSSYFPRISQYLSPRSVNMLEGGVHVEVSDDSTTVNEYRPHVLSDLANLERTWRLL